MVDSGEGGDVDGLAIAGTGVAWVEVCCHNSKEWALYEQTFETPSRRLTLGSGRGGADIDGPADSGNHVDSPAGAGPLLVFGSWQSARNPATSHYDVIQQSIVRASAAGCPCTTLRTDPGPLIIDDVDADHVVAHGNNGLLVLDGNGAQLSFIAIKPAAAALSGANLVMLVQGELRDYDWSSGHPDPQLASTQRFYRAGLPLRNRLRLPRRGHSRAAAPTPRRRPRAHRLHPQRPSPPPPPHRRQRRHCRPGPLCPLHEQRLVYSYGSRIHLVPYDQLPMR